MSVEASAPPPSPTPSLIEVKEETRLVLKSFLRHALALAPADRPGRIGGEYHDPSKYSVSLKEKQRKEESGWDSLDEQISAAEEKKHGIKNLIKRRLKPRPSTTRNSRKDGSADQSGSLERRVGQLEKAEKSSASEEESDRKFGDKKKKKNKLKLTELFKKKSTKKDDTRGWRPTTLPIAKDLEPAKPALSPSHPPEFYDDVAETLDRIAQKSVKKNLPTKISPEENAEPVQPIEQNKEAVVQQLVQLLTTEGDSINEKINTNPFLRKSLARLSYPSFAKLLDTCASVAADPPLPAHESHTLQRVAITMEMTRRVVTATGVTQRVEGYAERYMESFAPWVKNHGGWESIVLMEAQEYD
ncbi:bcl-2-like protein 12 [Electrophorus electricus]|uniref:Uncharacterized protein n=1 Tax=Electrophorus electricus TaxID=8005 RepID=A0A4W4FWC3_ELEEL|nr:bcl-2-like protein 12 [Electrophorus electricus]